MRDARRSTTSSRRTSKATTHAYADVERDPDSVSPAARRTRRRGRFAAWRRVAGAGDDLDPRVRQPRGHPLGDRAELLVALADHERHGHRELAQAVPQRRHRAGPEAAQRGGEPRGRVAQPVRVRGRGDRARLAGEQRLRGPLAANASTPSASIRSASASSAARRAARSAASASPGLAPTSTSRATRAGPSASAVCSAIRPPIE